MPAEYINTERETRFAFRAAWPVAAVVLATQAGR
jgi:hypothetical protein